MTSVVAISDTHLIPFYKYLPEGAFDLLLHCGDFMLDGSKAEYDLTLEILRTTMIKFKRAVMIPGNHDKYIKENEAQAKFDFKAMRLLSGLSYRRQR